MIRRVISANIPPKFASAQLSDLDLRVFGPVVDYGETMKAQLTAARRKGLLISGPPGVGKTHALAALTMEYIRRVDVPDVMFVTEPAIHEAYSITAPREGSQKYATRLQRAFWLVINDVGKTYRAGRLSEQVVARLGRIVRERAEMNLPTFFTTNLRLIPCADSQHPTFSRAFGDSFTSLVNECVTSYQVDGPDRRIEE